MTELEAVGRQYSCADVAARHNVCHLSNNQILNVEMYCKYYLDNAEREIIKDSYVLGRSPSSCSSTAPAVAR